jgi:hypothetical protein
MTTTDDYKDLLRAMIDLEDPGEILPPRRLVDELQEKLQEKLPAQAKVEMGVPLL